MIINHKTMINGNLFNLQDTNFYSTINSYLTEEILLLIITFSVLLDSFYPIQSESSKQNGYVSYYHLYYSFIMSFFLTNENILIHSVLFFGLDLIIQILMKTTQPYVYIRNIFILLSLLLIDKQELLVFSETYNIQQITTLLISLNSLHLLSDYTFEYIFSISYIISRIIIFNYKFFSILLTIKLYNSSWIVSITKDEPYIMSYGSAIFITIQNIHNIYMAVKLIYDRYIVVQSKLKKE